MEATALRVLVCGGRDLRDAELVESTLDRLLATRGPFERLIHGGARGVDRIAGTWARKNGVLEWDFLPEWHRAGTHDGIICTGESYKQVVKLTFAKGAALKDPARLFNASLEGNARRAIDIHEGEEVDASAFKALIRQAVALNSSGKAKPPKTAKP